MGLRCNTSCKAEKRRFSMVFMCLKINNSKIKAKISKKQGVHSKNINFFRENVEKTGGSDEKNMNYKVKRQRTRAFPYNNLLSYRNPRRGGFLVTSPRLFCHSGFLRGMFTTAVGFPLLPIAIG